MTKVAVFSHGSPDYLIDIVSDGMCRLLGRENVHYDYRFSPWHKERFNLLFNGFESPNSVGLYDTEALVLSSRCDFAIAQDWMDKTGRKAVALVDGEDEDRLLPFFERSKAYFKREMFQGRTYPPNIRPLQFAAVPGRPSARTERALPAFFMGSMSDPVRQDIVGVLRSMDLPVVLGKVPKADYDALLASSRIGVSARGGGWDTYRYWEIPYSGCLLLSQRLPLVVQDNFVEDREAVFFGDTAELRSKLKALLEAPDEVRRIAEAGQGASNSRHLSVHRAKTILEAVL